MTQNKNHQQEDKDTLIAIVKEMTQSFSGKESTKYWTDDTLWFDIPAFASKGIKPAVRMFDKVFSGMNSIKISILNTEVILSDDMGIVCTIQKAEIDFKDNKSKAMLVRETDCFKKSGGKWKLVHQHASVPAGGEWDGKIVSE